MPDHAHHSPQLRPASGRWRARVRESFERQGLMATLGARLGELHPGVVEILVDHDPRLTQQHGHLHAGVTGALADAACGYAAFTLAGDDETVLSIAYKVNLVAPARGERYRVRASVVAAGRRTKVVTATMHAETDGRPPELVAVTQATMLTPPGRDDAS